MNTTPEEREAWGKLAVARKKLAPDDGHEHCWQHTVNIAANSMAPNSFRPQCCWCGSVRPESVNVNVVWSNTGAADAHGPFAPFHSTVNLDAEDFERLLADAGRLEALEGIASRRLCAGHRRGDFGEEAGLDLNAPCLMTETDYNRGGCMAVRRVLDATRAFVQHELRAALEGER